MRLILIGIGDLPAPGSSKGCRSDLGGSIPVVIFLGYRLRRENGAGKL
jgi:hypothetical protein